MNRALVLLALLPALASAQHDHGAHPATPDAGASATATYPAPDAGEPVPDGGVPGGHRQEPTPGAGLPEAQRQEATGGHGDTHGSGDGGRPGRARAPAHGAHGEQGAAAKPPPEDLPSARDASGTAWQPDATPHAGHMLTAGGWSLMAHYQLFAGYDAQFGPRGASAPALMGWVMGMAERDLGTGRLTLRAMMSPEPFTASEQGGYPLLLQSGETWNGEPLHDRQHPHDLLMELAASYTHPLGRGWALQLYGGPAGEPALGPVAFPHRLSASADPLAPISHHWQDATHIAFGVVTAAVISPSAKLEASWFNGREPDEQRLGVDLRRFDSYSVRLTTNPSAHLSAQASYAFLASPEVLVPEESLHRLTTSLTYHRRLGARGSFATTAALGRNVGDHASNNAWLVEAMADLDGANVVFGRAELVQKTPHDLVLEGLPEDQNFPLGSLVAGYLRNFGPYGGVTPGLGVRVALNFVPGPLRDAYGALPWGGMLFVRLAPAPAPRHGGH